MRVRLAAISSFMLLSATDLLAQTPVENNPRLFAFFRSKCSAEGAALLAEPGTRKTTDSLDAEVVYRMSTHPLVLRKLEKSLAKEGNLDPDHAYGLCVMKTRIAMLDSEADRTGDTEVLPFADVDASRIRTTIAEYIGEKCESQRNAVLAIPGSKANSRTLDLFVLNSSIFIWEEQRALDHAEIAALKSRETQGPLTQFQLCVLTQRVAYNDRIDAMPNPNAGPTPQPAVPTPTPVSSGQTSTSPAQGGTGPQAHGWVCNPVGACAIRVSELRGYDKIKNVCPAGIPVHEDVFEPDQLSGVGRLYSNSKAEIESMLSMWEKNSQYLSAAKRGDIPRWKAYYKCMQANDWEPKPETYSFIDSIYENSAENTKTLFVRITTGDRELHGFSKTANPAAYLDLAMMPASQYDKFMFARTISETKEAIYRIEKSGDVIPFVSETCKPSAGLVKTMGDGGPWHVPTATLIAALDTLRSYAPRLVRTFPNGPTQAAATLAWLECMERNGWPDTAENTYYVVLKWGAARAEGAQ